MLKFAPAIDIKEVETYSDFAKLIISSFISFPNAQGHIYNLNENTEQFLETFYKAPGLRIMYAPDIRRLYVERTEKPNEN